MMTDEQRRLMFAAQSAIADLIATFDDRDLEEFCNGFGWECLEIAHQLNKARTGNA